MVSVLHLSPPFLTNPYRRIQEVAKYTFYVHYNVHCLKVVIVNNVKSLRLSLLTLTFKQQFNIQRAMYDGLMKHSKAS